jgi:DNA-binding NarL/FixJ family response regulator
MRNIIIADDHPITLQGIKKYVEDLGYIVMKTYENGELALKGILKCKPDLVILDLNMPGMNGLEVLEKVREVNAEVKIILYTMYQEKVFFERAKSLGVNGYLLKEFALEDLSICIEKVKSNEFWFSPKLSKSMTTSKHDTEITKINLLSAGERKILSLIGNEHSTKEIAEMLFISEKTVEKHRSNIIKKLDLPNEKNILQRFATQNSVVQNIISNGEG